MALSIDGTPVIGSSSTSAVTTGSFTNPSTNDIIVVVVGTLLHQNASYPTAPTVSTVTSSPALTWHLRKATGSKQVGTSGSNFYSADLETWWAYQPSATSQTVTVTLTGTPDAGGNKVLVFAVNGANTVSPWDANVSLPASGSSTTSSTASAGPISTTNATCMLLGFLIGPAISQGNPGAGYTSVKSGGSTPDAQYQTVSSTQSSISVAFTHSETAFAFGWNMLADAIQAAAPALPGFFEDTEAIRFVNTRRNRARSIPL